MRALLRAIDDSSDPSQAAAMRLQRGLHGYRGVSLEELADSYAAALKDQGAIDFPGMLLSLADLLDEDPWVLEHFQSLYRVHSG